MRILSLKAAIKKARAEQKKMQGQQKKEAPKTDKKEINEEGTFVTSILPSQPHIRLERYTLFTIALFSIRPQPFTSAITRRDFSPYNRPEKTNI
jgi:hypothetical protein